MKNQSNPLIFLYEVYCLGCNRYVFTWSAKLDFCEVICCFDNSHKIEDGHYSIVKFVDKCVVSRVIKWYRRYRHIKRQKRIDALYDLNLTIRPMCDMIVGYL
jgi:hypothetical protein